MHANSESEENSVSGVNPEFGDTEFGFEGGTDQRTVARDPPSPIPLPNNTVPDDPAVNDISHETRTKQMWRSGTGTTSKFENPLHNGHAMIVSR